MTCSNSQWIGKQLPAPLLLLLALPAGAALSQAPVETTPAFGFVDAEGARIHFLDHGGTGDPLVFLPGLGHTARLFDDFAPRFTDRHRVVAITRRGHGPSTASEVEFDLDTLIRDVLIVLDSLGIERASFVGHSYGGMEITRLAVDFPRRVDRLIYLDAAHDYALLEPVLARCPHPASLTSADSASWERVAAFHSNEMGFTWSESLVRSYYTFGADGRLRTGVLDPSFGGRLFSIVESPRYERVEAPSLAIYNVPPGSWSERSALPWHRALGDDPIEGLEECLVAIEAFVEGSIRQFAGARDGQVIRIPDGSHYPFEAHPERVEQAMRAFLTADEISAAAVTGAQGAADEARAAQDRYVAALNDEVPALVAPFYAAHAVLSLPGGGSGLDAELKAIVEEFRGDHDVFGVLFARFDGDSAAVHVAGDMGPADLLRIGSVSKVFLGFMFLQEGVNPDATIETSFPGDRFPDAAAITARMLLSHTSGIPDEVGRRVREMGEEVDPADMLRALQPILAAPAPPIDERIAAIYNQDIGFDFAPGTAWCYSNTGYLMLGRMLERATDQPIERLLDRHFGDVAPSLYLDDGREANFPASYPRPWPIHWSRPLVAGAMIATAADAVAAFHQVTQAPEFQQMQEWMTQPRCPVDIVVGDDYGLGLQRYAFDGIGDAIGHDGHIIARSILFDLAGTSYLVHTTGSITNPELRAVTERLLAAQTRSDHRPRPDR